MEEVEKIIQNITSKVTDLKQALSSVTSENQVLSEKIQVLEKQLTAKEEELKDFQGKINEFELQSNENTNSSDEDNVEIEAIVREIDDCISRLKQ